MQHTPARRLLAGLAVAGAVIGMSSAPAFAAPKAADIAIILTDVTVPIGETGALFGPLFYADEQVSVEDPTITYELSDGLTGVRLSEGDGVGDCESASPTKLVCSSWMPLEIGPELFGGYFDAALVAGETAEPGATGTVTATFSGTDLDPVTSQFKVRVAEAVDLTAGAPTTVQASPGQSFDTTYAVSNSGDKAINGPSAFFFNDWAFESDEQYSNCLYADGELQSCTFDETLEPGSSWETTMSYKLRADTMAPGHEAGEARWVTEAELEDFYQYAEQLGVEKGTPGTGDELSLDEAAAKRAQRAPQADKNPEDNWSYVDVEVTGKNGADLAAVGSAVTGKAGDEVKATAGVRNVGKATVDLSRAGFPAAVTQVQAPEGTSFVAAPDVCAEREGRPYIYECYSDYIFKAGEEETYEFVLHIDRVVPNAKGLVAVNEPCECERFTGDINKANNRAAILVNKTAGNGGGTGGGDGGDDPTLPITGPAGASLAVGGLVLLGLGAAAVMFTRRRRPAVKS
ncbi:hypothetical protein AB0M20_26120 [Actinoplanes sp. NPDC051633]|uniref:hypothetical protein n=1 Tax=Actinoplanes sp. NPDC051633 TaxID=3155670 RepID=UPI003412503A